MALFTFICYLLACILFLVGAVSHFGIRGRNGESAFVGVGWWLPVGLLLWLLPSCIAAGLAL